MNFKYLLTMVLLLFVVLFKSNAQIGNTMYFDGKQLKYNSICGTYIDVQGVFSTAAPKAFTVEYWINPTTLSNWNQDMGTNLTFMIHSYADGQLKAAQNTNENYPNYARAVAGTMVVNTWQHIAIVYDATNAAAITMKIYKNGSLVASSGNFTTPVPAWTAGFVVGNYNEAGLNGYLDEFRIWSKARTQDEINATKDIEITNPSSSSDLEVYCNFNDQTTPSALVKNYAKSSNTTTYYNHYVSAVSFTGLQKLNFTLSGTGATVSTGKISIYNASTNEYIGSVDKTNATSTVSPFVYDISSLALTFSTSYKIVVDNYAFYSPSKGGSGAFTKTLTTPAYLYDLNSATTYPTVNGVNIPTSLPTMKIGFSNPTIAKTTATSGKQITIRDKDWNSIAYVFVSDIQQATTPFTIPISASLSMGQKYTVVVDAGSFVSSTGIEEAQRIWSFNTISTTATNKVLTCGSGKYGTIVDAVTNVTSGTPVNSTFTEECWVRLDVMPTTYNELFSVSGDATLRPPVIFLYSNKQVHFGFAASSVWSGYNYTQPADYESGWNHIATSFDGTNYNLYCNGILKYTTTASSGKTFVNNLLYYLGKGITGAIDEVKIWNKALTLDELRISMYSTYSKTQAESITLLGSGAKLTGYWNFDDGLPVSEDLSINNNPVFTTGDLATNDNTAFSQFVYQSTTAPTGTVSVSPTFTLLFNRAVVAITGKLKITNVNTGEYKLVDISSANSSSVDVVSANSTGSRVLSMTSSLNLGVGSVYSVDFVGVKVFDFSGNVISSGFKSTTFTTEGTPQITEFSVEASAVPTSVIAVNSTASGLFYYKIVKEGSAIPNLSTLKIGTTYINLTADTRNTTNTVGAITTGNYKIYAVMTIGNTDVTSTSNVFTLIAPSLKVQTIVPSRSTVGATFLGDRKGIGYAKVVDLNATIPVNTSIVGSIYSITMNIANAGYNVSVSGLSKNSNYNLCSVMTDDAGNVSSVSVYTFSTTNDLITPTISVSNILKGQTTVTFDALSTEDATLYYQVLTTNLIPPTVTTLTTTSSSVSTTLVYNTKKTILITDLQKGSTYYIYAVTKNTAGTSAIYSFSLTTTQGVPTVKLVGSIIPTSNGLSAKANVSSDRAVGTYYWVVLNSTTAAPTSETALITMATSSTSASVTAGRISVTSINNPITIYGLQPNTNYVFYFLEVDGEDVSKMVSATFITPATDVSTELSNNDLIIYPNPAKDVVSISYNLLQSSEVSFDLYTSLGVKVKSSLVKQTKGEQKMTLDVSDLSNGTYIYQLRTANGTISKQLIINR